MFDKIQKLRELTGAGVMECKRALENSNGNLDQAVKLVHEQGLIKAETKKERKTGAGLLESYIHNGRIGVLLELRSETDFVAKSKPFRDLAHELAMQISAMAPSDVKELLNQPYIKDETMTVEQIIKRMIGQVGENIQIDKFCRYEL